MIFYQNKILLKFRMNFHLLYSLNEIKAFRWLCLFTFSTKIQTRHTGQKKSLNKWCFQFFKEDVKKYILTEIRYPLSIYSGLKSYAKLMLDTFPSKISVSMLWTCSYILILSLLTSHYSGSFYQRHHESYLVYSNLALLPSFHY